MIMPSRLIRVVTAACLMTAAAAPCLASDGMPASSAPTYVAGVALPQVVYYGDCGAALPTVLTIRSQFVSAYSLRVTARYDYVSSDPQLPESTILRASMAQVASLTYMGSIDVGAEAFAYLRGGSGVLRYQVSAVDALATASAGTTGTVVVRPCEKLAVR
ncbi:MAG TPA: hypothetical protein VKF82_12855 [Candidatus Eremiobacteraceae bacterium]|nr:hypothetical protein [Candidatus Eremiobacteraceae bacterium]